MSFNLPTLTVVLLAQIPNLNMDSKEEILKAAKVAAEAFNKSLAAGEINACFDYPFEAEDEAREKKKQEEYAQQLEREREAVRQERVRSSIARV